MKIYVDVYDHTAKPMYELIQRQLRRIGIRLVIRQTDFANYPTASIEDSVGLRRNGWPTADPVRLWQNYDSKGGDLSPSTARTRRSTACCMPRSKPPIRPSG